MVKIIMHGCNGHMGQVISGLVEKDPDAEIVAGIDVADQGKNSYPVYTNMEECQVEADALIDFSSAKLYENLMAGRISALPSGFRRVPPWQPVPPGAPPHTADHAAGKTRPCQRRYP